jgi:predicted Ser/Thr protein kinase
VSGVSYLSPGTVFAGRYEIGEELGRGGVSVVYAARDRQVKQNVALKLLVPSPATANQARERMRREVNAVRRLVHPNIVAVYDFVEDGPYGAVIMELVDGEDLDRRVRRAGALPADDVARIGSDVANALAAAHKSGVLHRDVKPQNILLAKDGRARLADFGSARMDGESTITRTGAIVGTLAYMAPEVLAGRRGDARADVFALGMTLFHAAAGRLPDRPSPHLPVPSSPSGHSPLGIVGDLPVWLAHVIARATSADPGDRYPTPVAFADALTNREARVAEGLAALSRQQCVLCGGLDVLGTSVCPGCSSGGRSADSFVFLAHPVATDDRTRIMDATADLLGDACEAETLAAVSSGTRPLMRVPAATGDVVVTALANRGLRARVIREREAWRALPPSFVYMLGAVVFAGVFVGGFAAPAIGLAAVPFALLLFAGGTMSLRRPVLSLGGNSSALSDRARAQAAEAFSVLPNGPARSLLADVTRRAQAVQRGLALRQDATGLGVMVDELVVAACASARDLAALDASLTQYDREGGREGSDSRWRDSLVECERTRDATVQRLLDAVTMLGQLDVQTIRGTDDASARLGELVAELSSEVRVRSAAREELGSLLAR